jgi:beta-glucuronidase
MKRICLIGLIALGIGPSAVLANQAVQDPKARLALNLDGKWNAIVDPYDFGYLNYRYLPYDSSPDPSPGFFNDHLPATKSELVEYSFDASPTLTVPKDWNTQESRLMLYEGAVWYRKRFDLPRSRESGCSFTSGRRTTSRRST